MTPLRTVPSAGLAPGGERQGTPKQPRGEEGGGGGGSVGGAVGQKREGGWQCATMCTQFRRRTAEKAGM